MKRNDLTQLANIQGVEQFTNKKVGDDYISAYRLIIDGMEYIVACKLNSKKVSKKKAFNILNSRHTQSNIAKFLGMSQSYVSKLLK